MKCPFCEEYKCGLDIDTPLYNTLKERFGNSRTIFQSDSWYVIPSLGGFVNGYLLAVNKNHYRSLYECPVNQQFELVNIINETKAVFENSYDMNLLFFEHGNISKKTSTNSIDHIHIHLLPFKHSFWGEMNKMYNFDFYKIDSIECINYMIEKNNIASYILFGDTDDKIYLIDTTNKDYPSQFLRIVLSEYLKMDKSWNWKNHYFVDKMYETYADLCSSFLGV